MEKRREGEGENEREEEKMRERVMEKKEGGRRRK